MAASNTINSLSNFTFSNSSLEDSVNLFTHSQTSKKFPSPKLDFTITVPNSLASDSIKIFNQVIPSSLIRENVKDADPVEQALFSPLLMSGAEVISDFSGQIRQTYAAYHKVYGTQNPEALAALGFTTGFSVISGTLNVRNGLKEIKTAETISDSIGKTLGNLKVAGGTAKAAGGAIFIPVRALSLAALKTSSKVVSTMAGTLGSIGSACFNFVIVLAMAGICIRLKEQHQFRSQLDGILKDPAIPEQERSIKALEYLKELASVSPQEKEEIRQELCASAEFMAMSPQQKDEKVEEKASLLLLKKEAHLKRLADEDCLMQIRQKGPAEANAVIEAVQKKSKEKIVLSSIGICLLTVGVMISIASFIFTGPIGIIVSSAVGLAISFSWLAIDAYGLMKEFKSADPGRFDKLWIFLSTALAVVSVALVFFLSGGIAPIIGAAVVGAIWLTINSTCYYRLYHKS